MTSFVRSTFRRRLALGAGALLLGLRIALAAEPPRPPPGTDSVLDARDAARKRDRDRLAADRSAALAAQHPLAQWVEYWELGARLSEAQQDELDAFAARWPGSYVEDRLRNDWLLELGRRRDWVHFRAEYPRFKLDDDREVRCYALLARHLDGEAVKAEARSAWLAQRDADDGCALLASTLFDAQLLTPADVWRKLRLAVEANRPRMARQAAGLLGEPVAAAVGELSDNAQRYLARKASTKTRTGAELTALALTRSAAADADVTAAQMASRWTAALPPDLAAWVWNSIGKQAAINLSDAATDYFQRAELRKRGPADTELSDDTLAWKVRAALRANQGAGRWQQVLQAITAMSPAEQNEPAWLYWKARALQAISGGSQDGATLVDEARALYTQLAVGTPPEAPQTAASGAAADTPASAPALPPSAFGFYGKLAAEALGRPLALPPKPAALTPAERRAAADTPGLQRALLLVQIGLRAEGVREWNFTLHGMDDRALLAAAQLACDNALWDRCINTSERTKSEVDMAQRFPTPYRQDVLARAKDAGIDPAYVYGLIRQESRFVTDARSGVGASGLMQLMPATAKWTARKLGIDYSHDRITDSGTNLQIGTGYLKLLLDDFDGSQALAAAGYNAGPSRPRKWRDGPAIDAAAWAENIPFAETRDYVKKVLSNACDYAAMLTGQPQSLRARLGTLIGPRLTPVPALDKDLP